MALPRAGAPWEWMEWAAVIARMVVVLDGFVRLKCCANGGPEQLEALEAIRMDAPTASSMASSTRTTRRT